VLQIGKHSVIAKSAFTTIPSSRIVPSPLHLFLGIGNKLITIARSSMKYINKNNKRVTITVKTKGVIKLDKSPNSLLDDYIRINIKQRCSTQNYTTKPSAAFDLNGKELSDLLEHAADFCALIPGEGARKRILKCFEYLKKLKRLLLSVSLLTQADLGALASGVKNIQSNWTKLTKRNPFPKLHMLYHAVEFAQTYGYLGRYSEAAIESHHGAVREAAVQHTNMAHQKELRLQRILSDLSTATCYSTVTSHMEVNRKRCSSCGGIYAKDYDGEAEAMCECRGGDVSEESDMEE
jgi:hypothetical protein